MGVRFSKISDKRLSGLYNKKVQDRVPQSRLREQYPEKLEIPQKSKRNQSTQSFSNDYGVMAAHTSQAGTVDSLKSPPYIGAGLFSDNSSPDYFTCP